MSNIVGIDLGTTFSAIARMTEGGKPEIVPDDDGHNIVPSVVDDSVRTKCAPINSQLHR